MKTKNTIKSASARLTPEKLAAFEKQATELFSGAKWGTLKIARWAASAVSGFGELTEEDALLILDPLARRLNDKQREINKAALAQLREDLSDIKRMIGSIPGAKFTI